MRPGPPPTFGSTRHPEIPPQDQADVEKLRPPRRGLSKVKRQLWAQIVAALERKHLCGVCFSGTILGAVHSIYVAQAARKSARLWLVSLGLGEEASEFLNHELYENQREEQRD